MFLRCFQKKNNKRYISIFIAIAIFFVLATNIMLSNIRTFFTEQTSEEMYKLVDSYSYVASRMKEAEIKVQNLVDEKIKTAAATVIEDREKVDNDFLDKIAENHFVDKIYWYSPDGTILFAKDSEYIGWEVYEGHPVQNFLDGNLQFFIENTRKDSESDRRYKYGYMKAEDGYFVQIGVSADRIYELLNNFSLDSLASNINKSDYVESAYFTKHLPVMEKGGYQRVFREDIKSLEEGSLEGRNLAPDYYSYFEKPYEPGGFHEISFPIYSERGLVGYLNIVHSMGETESTIRKFSVIAAVSMTLALIALSSGIVYMYGKKDELGKSLYYDSLTGLPNKKKFSENLSQSLEEDSRNKSALVLINISKFKSINVIFGYEAGDEVLVETVNRIKKIMPANSCLYRFSDDRFVLHIEKYKEDNTVEEACTSLVKIFEPEFKVRDMHKNINIKMGALELYGTRYDIDQAMKDLSIALENASSAEGSRYCFFDSSMKEMIIREEQIERVLKKALDDDSETIYFEYQPKVDLKTEKVVGFEALARMKSDELGYVSPVEFIRIAEERQLIIYLW